MGGEGGAKREVQGPPNERGTQIVNAPFTVFNYTLEGEEGGVQGGRGCPPFLLRCTAFLIHPWGVERASLHLLR